MKRINGTDIQVKKDDQNDINAISRLLQKKQDLDQSLAKAKQKINQHKDSLEQLDTMLDDSEIVRYRFGSCFFYLPADKVKEIVQKQKTKVMAEQKEVQIQREDTDKRIKKLKAKLYSKFGNAINLQE